MHTGTVAMSFEDLDKPIIAALNGVAVGAGLSMALACDIRIASENARFGAIWVKRGLIPDAGATWFLPRVLPYDKAIELAFTGDLVGAREALEMGLVTRVVPHDQLMPEAEALAGKIAKGPSVAIELIKRGFRRSLTNDLKSQLDYETYAQNLCRRSEDHREGVKSFMEKRPPEFKGR
jgi:2-(1,2-epoxy-1,2-dihydrophenyl)acetyl-CoA isomerase